MWSARFAHGARSHERKVDLGLGLKISLRTFDRAHQAHTIAQRT